MLPSFAYIRPKKIDAAIAHLADPGAAVHAGGTDLLGCLREGIVEVKKVVSLSGLQGLRGIAETADGGVRIGALTPIAQVAADPRLNKRFSALAQAAGEVASPQLRNQGTLGGNLCQKPRCWYYRGEFHCLRKGGDTCYAAQGENHFHAIFGGGGACFIVHPSDTAPALVALNASVTIRGPKGERRVKVENFHVLPEENVALETVLEADEIVTEIEIPAPPASLKSSYRKVRTRRSWDFAIAGLALALEMDGPTVKSARLVLSGAAPVPWRLPEVEKLLTGKPLTPKLAGQAGKTAMKGAMPLKHNAYKVPLFEGMIAEELEKRIE